MDGDFAGIRNIRTDRINGATPKRDGRSGNSRQFEEELLGGDAAGGKPRKKGNIKPEPPDEAKGPDVPQRRGEVIDFEA